MTIDGCRAITPADTEVAAGQAIGETAGRIWIQVTRAGISAPRFAPASLVPAWRTVVADPSALIPGLTPAPVGSDDLLARREASFADVQEHYFADPPVMVRGWREHLIDTDGRVYLDTLNNVTSVGHAHPRLVEAVAGAVAPAQHELPVPLPAVVEFSERLAALAPDPLDTVFLVNSGSEAVDLALRLGQAWSGRRDVLAVREAYHGWTYLTDAVSTSIADNPAALQTRPDWCTRFPLRPATARTPPMPWRVWRSSLPEAPLSAPSSLRRCSATPAA